MNTSASQEKNITLTSLICEGDRTLSAISGRKPTSNSLNETPTMEVTDLIFQRVTTDGFK